MNYWQKQTRDEPLFSDLLWSRPEHRTAAGKLAIAGGNAQGFSAVAQAYQAAQKTSVGTARVLLPDSIKKLVGPVLPEGEFAPSNPSGSFSQKALVDLLDLANWADATLITGDLGRNSETAILLERFVSKYRGPVTLTKDAVDYFTADPKSILGRDDTLLVLSLSQLQKMTISANLTITITFSMDLLKLVETLHELTSLFKIEIMVKHLNNILVAVDGQVSTTKLHEDIKIWRVDYAAKAAVWRLQNPTNAFGALTTSVIN